MATHTKGNSITKTVSMDPEMGSDAENRAAKLGFRSFSAYVQNLVRADLMDGGDLTLREKPANSNQSAADQAAVTALVKSAAYSLTPRTRKKKGV